MYHDEANGHVYLDRAERWAMAAPEDVPYPVEAAEELYFVALHKRDVILDDPTYDELDLDVLDALVHQLRQLLPEPKIRLQEAPQHYLHRLAGCAALADDPFVFRCSIRQRREAYHGYFC